MHIYYTVLYTLACLCLCYIFTSKDILYLLYYVYGVVQVIAENSKNWPVYEPVHKKPTRPVHSAVDANNNGDGDEDEELDVYGEGDEEGVSEGDDEEAGVEEGEEEGEPSYDESEQIEDEGDENDDYSADYNDDSEIDQEEED